MRASLVPLFKRQSIVASVGAFLVSGLVLLNWAFDVPLARSIRSGLLTMKANTAVCFVLAAAALFILGKGLKGNRARLLAYAFGGAVLVLGVVTLLEYVTHSNLNIDQMLFADRSELAATFPPGRMSPATAINFIYLGTALLLLAARRAFGLMQILVLLILVYSMFALVGYLYGARSLYDVMPHPAIAIHTAATFIVLGLGILCNQPERGLMAMVSSTGLAGLMVRRLLPAALVLPLVIGWLRLAGQRAGYYGTEFGIALFALLNVIIFASLTLLTARLVHRLDNERVAVDTALRQAHEGMEARVKERTAELESSNLRLSLEIAERAKAEEVVRKRDEQLRHTQKMEAVGRLAGGIAHQFNNLMTAVIGFSDLLLMRKKDSDPDFGKIQEIKKAGQRAAGLTSQLLTFSRRQVHQPTRIDVNQVIMGLDEILRGLLGSKMTLATSLEPCLCTVMADRAQLEEILINLAINARDAMKPGGLLTIRTANVCLNGAASTAGLAPGNYVLLSTRDTGSGMDAETQAQIFEPFFTTKPQGQGTGLGLAVIDGIVKQSGGHIDVISARGEGATFNVYLPRLEDLADQPISQFVGNPTNRATSFKQNGDQPDAE